MKLRSRAMCLNADILLMDELNHLDVMNVKRVESTCSG